MKMTFKKTTITSRIPVSRRSLLKLAGAAGIAAAFPDLLARRAFAELGSINEVQTPVSAEKYPDWIAEARIYGLSVSGLQVDPARIRIDLDRVIEQGANVIEADSRLSDYLPDDEFAREMKLIKETTALIHERGLKVVWYIPSLEVLTPNGVSRKDSFGRLHPDWLQLSFDRKRRGIFYGQLEFWVGKNDESAWMCPNSPFREWFKERLIQLSKTGVDGIWLDVPLFGLLVAAWGCSCDYCQEKFTRQTGMEFPQQFDVTEKRFRRYIQWRHETLTEFIEDCKSAIQSGNPKTITIAEVVALDHLGAVEWGTEGSSMHNNFVVWEQDGVSEATAMADAGYDDWINQYNSYKYFRGATKDRPSWAFCYGYKDNDAQLVMAGAIASQNNPYELRVPKMTTSVGMEFRGMMYNWIAQYSRQIYRSKSMAPVAVLYSERNRDLLDAVNSGGMVIASSGPTRGRVWLGTKEGSPLNLEYMGDYCGLGIFLHQHQIPTDVHPFSRVDDDLIGNYRVLVLPYMASLSESEKEILIKAVEKGATLIVSGPEPGKWDALGERREKSLWSDIAGSGNSERESVRVGKGQVHFWREQVGRRYLRTHEDEIAELFLPWLQNAGVTPWVNKKQPVVVQPYIYKNQVIVHVLNYSWIGNINNRPEKLSLELSIPWENKQGIKDIIQSEPQWSGSRAVAYKLLESSQGNRLSIPLEVGINSLIVINKNSQG